MPLVKTGHQSGPEHGDTRPAESPFCVAHDRQRFAPGAEQQDAEQSVTEYVAALADVDVPVLEAGVIQAEQEMQNGIENAAGVVGGKVRAGLNGNDDQPQDGGDPGFENVVTVGGHADLEPKVPRFPPFAKCAKGGAPSFVLVNGTLLDGIVRGLAGDHYIVNVAFAEAGAADADEARFL